MLASESLLSLGEVWTATATLLEGEVCVCDVEKDNGFESGPSVLGLTSFSATPREGERVML